MTLSMVSGRHTKITVDFTRTNDYIDSIGIKEKIMEGWTFWNVSGKWFGQRLKDGAKVSGGTYTSVVKQAQWY